MADSFPQMITGYTESGKALVDLGENAEEATGKLKEMFDATKAEYAGDIKKQLPDIETGIAEENKDIDKEIEELEKQLKAYENYRKYLDTATAYSSTGEFTASLGSIEDEGMMGDLTAVGLFGQLLEKAGIDNM